MNFAFLTFDAFSLVFYFIFSLEEEVWHQFLKFALVGFLQVEVRR